MAIYRDVRGFDENRTWLPAPIGYGDSSFKNGLAMSGMARRISLMGS